MVSSRTRWQTSKSRWDLGGSAGHVLPEVVAVGLTRRGRGRDRNEDALLLGRLISQAEAGGPVRVRLPTEGGLIAVADGLGGGPTGPRASTVAGLAFSGGGAVSFNVGDSRCYRADALELELVQLSTDDERSLAEVGEALTCVFDEAAGRLSAVGSHPRPSPAAPGTRFLVCTDGLHDVVPRDVMAAVVAADWSLERIAERLHLLAVQLGALDDITLVVAEVTPACGS